MTLMVTVVGVNPSVRYRDARVPFQYQDNKKESNRGGGKAQPRPYADWKRAWRSDPVKQSQIIARRSREQSQCRSERY